MEIIDRPLADIIKEQKIDKELRRRPRTSQGGNRNRFGSSRRRSDNNNNNNREYDARRRRFRPTGAFARDGRSTSRLGFRGRRSDRARGRDNNNNSGGGGSMGGRGNRGGRFGLSRQFRSRRLSYNASSNNGRGNGRSGRPADRDDRRLSPRRGAVDYGDIRERGAKSGPRRFRVSDAERNDRTRMRQRRDVLRRSRYSRD